MKQKIKTSYPVITASKNKVFTYVEKEKNKVYITLANYLLWEKHFKNVQQAEDFTKTLNWEFLTNVICAITTKINENEKSKTNTNN